jgi:protein SPA2
MLDQLRTNIEGLLTELSDLSRWNDELMTAKDIDLVVIRDLDSQLKEYKQKYEQPKTELRSVKGDACPPLSLFIVTHYGHTATLQLFLQAPKQDDQLPVSTDGGLLDIHVTAFISAIDSLLTAGRANAPTRFLTSMKSVVNAVPTIIEDVCLFERRLHCDRSDVDKDVLRSLRERGEATLSNLVAASRTHVTNSGMSPFILLDAAASHVSATVTEIGRTVCMRKASRADQKEFASTATVSSLSPSSSPAPHAVSSSSGSNGFSSSLRMVDELKPSRQKKPSSSAGSRRMDVFGSPSAGSRFGDARGAAAPSGRPSLEDTRRIASEPSSSDMNSPPPIFDHPPSRSTGGLLSDDSANAEI